MVTLWGGEMVKAPWSHVGRSLLIPGVVPLGLILFGIERVIARDHKNRDAAKFKGSITDIRVFPHDSPTGQMMKGGPMLFEQTGFNVVARVRFTNHGAQSSIANFKLKAETDNQTFEARYPEKVEISQHYFGEVHPREGAEKFENLYYLTKEHKVVAKNEHIDGHLHFVIIGMPTEAFYGDIKLSVIVVDSRETPHTLKTNFSKDSVRLSERLLLFSPRQELPASLIDPADVRNVTNDSFKLKASHIEHLNLYLDSSDTFWEVAHVKGTTPFYSAVLRLNNEASRPLNRLRARLTFTPIGGQPLPPLGRACWVRHRYNEIDLAAGDPVGLVVAHGLSETANRKPPILGMVAVNNHYNSERYDEFIFAKYEEPVYRVDVRVVSGDAGNVRFEGSFRAQFQPYLLVTEWSDS
jgi:hypothetical protein